MPSPPKPLQTNFVSGLLQKSGRHAAKGKHSKIGHKAMHRQKHANQKYLGSAASASLSREHSWDTLEQSWEIGWAAVCLLLGSIGGRVNLVLRGGCRNNLQGITSMASNASRGPSLPNPANQLCQQTPGKPRQAARERKIF